MSRLAKYNALSAEIKRCEREQAFLGYGGGDSQFVGTMKFGGDEGYGFSDGDDDDDDDAEEYPEPLEMFTPEEERERLEKTLGVVVDDKSEETEGDWDDEFLENHKQPRNITDEQLEALLRAYETTSYIPASDNRSVSLTDQELKVIRGNGDEEQEPSDTGISYYGWPL